MKTGILSIIILLYGNSSLIAQDSLKYQSLDPYYFHLKYITDSNSILIDVREFFEYRHARIKDAVHVPTSGKFDFTADTLDKNKSLFLYCYNDYRSRMAAEFFIEKGFRYVYNLEGGIIQWRKDKMPVDRKRVRRK